MPKRAFQLALDISDAEVFYHWNYDPPVKNIGGGMGIIFPTGHVYDSTFLDLRTLGSGSHPVQLDETLGVNAGPAPTMESEDDRLFRLLRFALFMEEHDCCIAGEPYCTIVWAMTPGNADRIIPLLSESHIQHLQRFASQIAATKYERDQQSHTSFSNATGYSQIPDEVLDTIRLRFRQT